MYMCVYDTHVFICVCLDNKDDISAGPFSNSIDDSFRTQPRYSLEHCKHDWPLHVQVWSNKERDVRGIMFSRDEFCRQLMYLKDQPICCLWYGMQHYTVC